MPLTWDTVTVASRVMLRTYPVFNGCYGLALLLTPLPDLLAVPAYRTLNGILPMQTWALAFLVVALVQVAALVIHRRASYVFALALMVVLCGIFCLLLAYGALRMTNPWTAPPFAMLATCAAYASLKSLASRES
jgi:hypothetical protein